MSMQCLRSPCAFAQHLPRLATYRHAKFERTSQAIPTARYASRAYPRQKFQAVSQAPTDHQAGGKPQTSRRMASKGKGSMTEDMQAERLFAQSWMPTITIPIRQVASIFSDYAYEDHDNAGEAKMTRGEERPAWNGKVLTFFENGSIEQISVQWLRDNCQCETCTHPITKQRQINVFDMSDEAFKITKCDVNESTIDIDWQDGHHSVYPIGLFMERRSARKEARRRGLDKKPKLWDSSIAKSPPSVSFDAIQKNGVGKLLRQIRVYGFCFVPGCPETPDATQSLLETIGPIRNTHYGGFYDFTSDMASKDTAYTDLALEAHTDTTYFSEPAGLQAFHMLSHTEGTGGESLLVDGFHAANQLIHQSREHYFNLSTIGVNCHASGNDDVSIQPYAAFPVLEHDFSHRGPLVRVRWNNADRAGISGSIQKTNMWYEAARAFDSILKARENQYWFKLQPGTPLIFDNWRILHGRAAFTGKRRMCGAYINRDDWISKYRLTNYGREGVMASTVTG